MPAFAQASSFGCPPTAPLRPTPPIVSSPTLMGIPPPSGITSASWRCPALLVSVFFAHCAEGWRNVRAVYALRRASSILCGLALSPWRKTRSRPARSTTATEVCEPHSAASSQVLMQRDVSLRMALTIAEAALHQDLGARGGGRKHRYSDRSSGDKTKRHDSPPSELRNHSDLRLSILDVSR